METFESLPAEEVIKAIEFASPSRIPTVFTKWWGEGLYDQYGERLQALEVYPEDACIVPFPCPNIEPRPDGFFWRLPDRRNTKTSKGLDSSTLLPSWDDLDRMEAEPPDFTAPGLFDKAKRIAERGHAEGKYILLHHWGLLFERIWGFRGMANLLMDYFLYPDEVHRLHRIVTDTEIGLLKRAFDEIQPHGYMHSDDLGNQRALMMNPSQFREFIKPYYAEIWGTCRQHGVHVWLHTCGNVTEIIGDLIEAGLNVLHPIQKHTMDEKQVARDWGGKIAIWVGIDVQHTLQQGTPERVREEVRFLIDTFDREDGGMLLASGNGIVAGTPYENIEAYLDECYRYGKLHRQMFSG